MIQAFKFMVPSNKPLVLPEDGSEWSGMLAICTAPNVEEARALLHRYGHENGLDSRWIDHASVRIINLDTPAVLGWAAV